MAVGEMAAVREVVARRLGRVLHAEWLALLLLGLALTLRVWGINFGLPYSYHPDEHVVIGDVVILLHSGTPDPSVLTYPHGFGYPSGLYYLFTTALAAYQLLTGTIVGPAPSETGLGLYPTPGAVLLARIVVALLSALTVLVVYRAARGFAGTWPAAGAALLLACSALSISLGQVATTDAPSALGMALVAACCLLAVRSEHPVAFWYAGLALGLATGLKYNVAAGGVMLLAAYIVVVWRQRQRQELTSWHALRHDPRLWGFALIPVGFLLTTPYVLRHPGEFARDMLATGLHYGVTGHPGAQGNSLTFTLVQMFVSPEGALSVLACVGLVSALWRKRAEPLVIASGAVAYFIVVAAPKVHFARNLGPLWPLLAILAAEGLYALARALPRLAMRVQTLLGRRPGQLLINGALLTAFVVGLVPMCASAVQFDQMRTETDVRTVASQWLAAHLPAGSHVAVEPYSVTLDPGRYDVAYVPCGLFTEPMQWYPANGIQYAVASALTYYRYVDDGTDYRAERQAYLNMFSAWPLIKAFVGDDTSGGTVGLTIQVLRVPPADIAPSTSTSTGAGSQATACPP